MKALALAGMLALAASAAALAQAPQPIGIAAAVLNRVTIARGGAAQSRPAVLRQQVAMADRVETGQRSQLQLLLLDRSTFTVGANARLTIDRFVYDPASGRSMSASVAKGAFRFMSGRPSRGGASTIATPVASIGIRGTIIDGVIGAEAITIASGERGSGGGRGADPEGASLIILRGPGANPQGKAVPGAISVTAGGKTVALERPLQAVFVPRAGAQPIGPFTISPSGLNRVQGLIFPSLAEWRLATAPLPTGPYRAPPSQQRRGRPGLVGDPVGIGPEPATGMIPGQGGGLPNLPSMPRSASVPAQPDQPPARTAASRPETVPEQSPPPAADPPSQLPASETPPPAGPAPEQAEAPPPSAAPPSDAAPPPQGSDQAASSAKAPAPVAAPAQPLKSAQQAAPPPAAKAQPPQSGQQKSGKQ